MLHCEVAIASPERIPALQTPGTAGAAVWEFETAPAGGGVHLPAPPNVEDQHRALTWSIGGSDGAECRTLELCEASLRGAEPAAEAARLEFPSALFSGAAAVANGGATSGEAAAAVVVVLTADAVLHRISVPFDRRRGRAAPGAIDADAIRTLPLEAAAAQLGTPTALVAAVDGTVVIAGSEGCLLAVPAAAFAEGDLLFPQPQGCTLFTEGIERPLKASGSIKLPPEDFAARALNTSGVGCMLVFMSHTVSRNETSRRAGGQAGRAGASAAPFALMDGRRLGMSIFGRGAVAAVVDVAPLPTAGRHALVAALHADSVVRVRMRLPKSSRFFGIHWIDCTIAAIQGPSALRPIKPKVSVCSISLKLCLTLQQAT